MKTFLIIVAILVVLFIIKSLMKFAWRVFWLVALIAVAAYLIIKYIV
jgi:hypothetical protein